MTSALPTCPACHGTDLHMLPVGDLEGRSSRDCLTCAWVRWPDDELGCNRCLLHWSTRGRDRHGYSISRAALLLGVTVAEMNELYMDNLSLRLGALTEAWIVRRTPLHGLAALLR